MLAAPSQPQALRPERNRKQKLNIPAQRGDMVLLGIVKLPDPYAKSTIFYNRLHHPVA